MNIKTKLKTILYLTITLFVNAGTVFGQENSNSKTIKLYTNFSWGNTQETLSTDSINMTSTIVNSKETQIGYLTPSLSITTSNGNFHEFELSRLLFKRSNSVTSVIIDSTGNTLQVDAGQKTTNILIAFRYEYDIMFFKNKKGSKMQTYLGFSANPYFSNSRYVPVISTSYPTNQNKIGALFSIIPRLNYNLNEKWFLDLNIPINLIDLHWTFKSDENPTLTEQERKTTTINFSTLPSKFLIRFGVGLRI